MIEENVLFREKDYIDCYYILKLNYCPSSFIPVSVLLRYYSLSQLCTYQFVVETLANRFNNQ